MKLKIINDLDLRKQADDLGLKVWQTPGFLFLMMGVITVAIMTATYFISKNYDNPQVLVVSECLITIIIFTIGTIVTNFFSQLAKVNKMKSEFVSVASHQLKTPLSAIKWEIELLLKKFKKGFNPKQLESIENISLLNQKMIRLVNDLLDVTRIEQSRFILKKQPFDFIKMTEKTLREIMPSMKHRHIEVVLNFKKNMPMAFGDPEKMKLVVENLANNALKYTTSGGKIEIKIFKKKDNLIFEIKDNGVGIPEEQIDQVFDKFFRSDNAVRYQTEGAGLGLYISKSIVEQSGGKIWFQSIENVGSMFSFSLPLAKKLESVKF